MSRALRLPVAAAVLAAASITWPGAASADQQSSVQAQIGALQTQLRATGRQVHSLTFAYTAAQVQVAALSQQLAGDQARAQQAAAEVGRTGAALRQEVLDAYMGDSSGPAAGTIPGRGIADPAVRYGYISIATSGVQDSLDRYRTARAALTSALATVTAQQQAALAASRSVDRARQAALSEASQAGARLVGLESQLATLEQQAAAAQAAAQAAAAARAAAARSTATPPPPPSPPARTQGGPVQGGLMAVVRAQVEAPAPPAPVVPPTTLTPPAPSTTLPSAPPPTVAPAPSQPAGSAGVWLQLRECESGNDYQANTGNGFYGAYQFSQQTWTDLGYPGRPDLEPPAMQDQAAQQLQARSGWGQWPACSAALGLS